MYQRNIRILQYAATCFLVETRRFINYSFNCAKRIMGAQIITCMFSCSRSIILEPSQFPSTICSREIR